GGQPVAGPQSIRCSLEAKVIGLQSHMSPRWLVQQHGQAQRARLALANAPQQKILSDAAFDHGIHQQDVAALEFGAFLAGGHGLAIGEENFAAARPPWSTSRTSSRTKCTTTGASMARIRSAAKTKARSMVTTTSSLRPWQPREISRPRALTRFAIRAALYVATLALVTMLGPR